MYNSIKHGLEHIHSAIHIFVSPSYTEPEEPQNGIIRVLCSEGNMKRSKRMYSEKERCEELAQYLIEKQSTVRDAAARFGISKSTVHKDVSEKLPQVNPALAAEVHRLFEKNKSERHLRGGEATKQKYLHSASHKYPTPSEIPVVKIH